MIRQVLVISLLMIVRSSLADEEYETEKQERPLVEERTTIYDKLFNATATKQGIEETLRQLKWVDKFFPESGDPMFRKEDRPEYLISLYRSETTCNPDRSHDISKIIDYNLIRFGHNNVVEYLKVARRNQLAGCQFHEIKSKFDETMARLEGKSKAEISKLIKFIKGLDSGTMEKLKHSDNLPEDQLAGLLSDYLDEAAKSSCFKIAMFKSSGNQVSLKDTILRMDRISYTYRYRTGWFVEVSKEPSVWDKLDRDMQNKILAGRFCILVGSSDLPKQLSKYDVRSDQYIE